MDERYALGDSTASRSARLQRRYASWSTSSASASEPSIRYARRSRDGRCSSKRSSARDMRQTPIRAGLFPIEGGEHETGGLLGAGGGGVGEHPARSHPVAGEE